MLNRVREEGGFTLIELLVAMGLLLVVLSLAYSVYSLGNRSVSTSTTQAHLQRNVRLALEFTDRETRTSEPDPAVELVDSSGDGVKDTVRYVNEVEYEISLNEAGSLIRKGPGGEIIVVTEPVLDHIQFEWLSPGRLFRTTVSGGTTTWGRDQRFGLTRSVLLLNFGLAGNGGGLPFDFADDVFLYGTKIDGTFKHLFGNGANIVLDGLSSDDLNSGAVINSSSIYIFGDVDLWAGQDLGSPDNPNHDIHIRGDLDLSSGNTFIYANKVFVDGDLMLRNGGIFAEVYVRGDVTLGWGKPAMGEDARIYYMGSLTSPYTLDECVGPEEPGFPTFPDSIFGEFSEFPEPPSIRPVNWYEDMEYEFRHSGSLSAGARVFSDSEDGFVYTGNQWTSFEDVIIVSKYGDIRIDSGFGSSSLTGVLYAPNGSVSFTGGGFTGLVIARDGFFVEVGGNDITFLPLQQITDDPAPFE